VTAAADPKTKDAPVAEATETVDSRPPIAKMFDRLGIKKGSKFKVILLVGGEEIRSAVVEEVIVCADPFEVALVVGEDGAPSRRHILRWACISALKP
jgi:hypothetical protein